MTTICPYCGELLCYCPPWCKRHKDEEWLWQQIEISKARAKEKTDQLQEGK